MKKKFGFLLLAILMLFVVACQKVPITGRKQVKLLPSSMINQMGEQSYQSFLKESPPVNPPTVQSAIVTNVGRDISIAVERYMRDNGMSKRLEGYKWEFNTVESSDVNAWCMPGGKVVVYTGILPVTRDETGLAVVMGHEIAHAIAEHGNERMSQQIAIQLGGISLAVALQEKPQQTQEIFLAAYGVTSQLGQLAYSRQHELEADKLGLIFMAMAGYNPERAVTFWQEMAAKSGNHPPEILSTHPSDTRRIAQIKAFLPEAMKYYKPGSQSTPGTTIPTPGIQKTTPPIQKGTPEKTNPGKK